MKLAHITSMHLPGLWKARMDYLNSLRPDVVNVLALCGEQFEGGIDGVDYEPKFYAPGRRCYRAREFFYGFLDLGIDADYLMYTDYDHLILRKDYVEILMDRIGEAAVLGRGMQCMNGRTGGQMRKLPSNYDVWLKKFSVRKHIGIYCCLGTGEVLRTDFLREWRAMGEKIHATSEIHVPTVAYNLGYEVKTDVEVFKHVFAGTKEVSIGRVKKVMEAGGVSIHPFKDLENTGRVYDMIRKYNRVNNWDRLLAEVDQMEPMEHWQVSQQLEADFWEGFIKKHNYTRGQWSRFKLGRLESAFSGFPSAVRELLEGAKRILDVGCGAWSVVESMPGRVVAIDPNLSSYVNLQPDVLALGLMGNVEYRSCVVQDVQEENFDVAWCHNVLDHTGDWREIISECARVLVPGGSLLIGTNVIYGLISKRRRVTHPSKFTAEQLLSVLRQNGFKIKWHSELSKKRRWFFQVWAENE